MNMHEIKERLLQELKKDIPDLVFIYKEATVKCMPAILEELLEKEKWEFNKKLEANDRDITFELFDDDSELSYLFSLLQHFHSVNGNDETRKIIADFEPKYMDFWNEVQYSKRYYEMLKICLKQNTLDQEQIKILTDWVKSYEVKGINIWDEKQIELKKINKLISDLSRKFSENELDSENLLSYHSEKIWDFSELPAQVLDWAKQKAEDALKKWYLFGSSPTEYIAIMKYCSSSEVRKYFYVERNKIASEWKYDNRPIVLELLTLKDTKAKILWFKNYAELSLYFKMAENVWEVMTTLDTIAIKAKVKANEEVTELKAHFWLNEIYPEDIWYYFRKYKEERYHIDEKELKKYFEYEKCLDWMFKIIERLYDIKIILKKDAFTNAKDTFLDTVAFYEIYKNDILISYFMIDPYYRQEKRSGAWANNLRGKEKNKLPLIINVYNIQQSEWKTLLDLREVETMFHEFWHALHEMLSESQHAELSGFHVEHDFVEVPSQFHEHFCHEKESLDIFAQHFETGKKIPTSLLKNLKAYERVWNGNMVLTQCQFASIDMMLHGQDVPKNIEELDNIILNKVNELSIIEKGDNYKMYCSFSHIFDGWYAAWYYSYMWSEILELDIWKEFLDAWIFNPEISHKFLNTILSQWSKKEAKQLFHDFKGADMDVQGFFEFKWL